MCEPVRRRARFRSLDSILRISVKWPRNESGLCSRDPVPKGRFELPRVYTHYALNVARLPFRHFGMMLRTESGCRADPGTRTPDLLFTKQLLYQLS
jgi:hypothetical protein